MITILSTILNTISILLWMHLLGNIEYRHKHPTILVLILSLSVAIINYILPSVLGVFSGILLLCISAQILSCGKWWTLCIHTRFLTFFLININNYLKFLAKPVLPVYAISCAYYSYIISIKKHYIYI